MLPRSRRDVLLRGTNVALRLASTGSRVILLLLLARLLPPSDIGRYGLFLATVALGLSVLGGEFHTYSIREMLRRPREQWSFVLQHAAAAWGLVYLLAIPAFAIAIATGMLGEVSAFWLPVVMVAEHLCQEGNRFLNAMQRPLLASSVQFVRMGAWVWLVVPWMWLHPSARSLETVYAAWAAGAYLALALGWLAIVREAGGWKRWPMDWSWMRRGVGVCLLYLVSTFVFRAFFSIDRYVVQLLAGASELGPYVLYIGLTGAAMVVIDPAVIAFLQPQLVEAWHRGERARYRLIFAEIVGSVLLLSTLLCIAIAIAAPYLVAWTGKAVYAADYPLLWILLLMSWVCANGLALDCALYARHLDRGLALSMTLGLLAFLACTPLLLPLGVTHAVAWALTIGFAVAYLLKARLLLRPE